MNTHLHVLALVSLVGCAELGRAEFPPDVRCAECSLELRPDVRILPVEPEVHFLIATKLASDASGRFHAAPLVAPSRIATYSPEGDYLRAFGARGSGPGELGEVEHFSVGRADSIFLVDRTRRLTIFSPEGEAVRSVALGTIAAVHDTRSSGLVIGENWLGGQVWLADREAGARRQIGPAEVSDSSWSVQVAPDGMIWAVSSTYRIEVYSESGALLHEVDLSEALGDPDERYRTQITSMAFPEGDLLMVLVVRRDLEWQRQPGAGEESIPVMLTVEEASDLNEFYLDIVDWRAGTLLVRTRLPGMFVGGFLGHDRLYTVESNQNFDLSLQTWQILFSR